MANHGTPSGRGRPRCRAAMPGHNRAATSASSGASRSNCTQEATSQCGSPAAAVPAGRRGHRPTGGQGLRHRLLVLGVLLDAREEIGAAAETVAQLVVPRSLRPPAQNTPFEGTEPVVAGRGPPPGAAGGETPPGRPPLP